MITNMIKYLMLHRLTLSSLFLIIFTFNVSYAVEVVESSSSNAENSEEVPFFVTLLVFIMITALVLGIIITLTVLVIAKISQFFQDKTNARNDFLYSTFMRERKKCIMNASKQFKKRNWKTFFIFHKRQPVYLKTKRGLKVIGFYDGEGSIKQNFYMINLFNKTGIFSYQNRLLMIPNEIKDNLVEIYQVDKKSIMVLHCEGVDNFENVEYYLMPLIEDPRDHKRFLNFSHMFHKSYVEDTTYQEIIKNNLLSYKKNVEDAVESNLDVNFKRRS